MDDDKPPDRPDRSHMHAHVRATHESVDDVMRNIGVIHGRMARRVTAQLTTFYTHQLQLLELARDLGCYIAAVDMTDDQLQADTTYRLISDTISDVMMTGLQSALNALATDPWISQPLLDPTLAAELADIAMTHGARVMQAKLDVQSGKV